MLAAAGHELSTLRATQEAVTAQLKAMQQQVETISRMRSSSSSGGGSSSSNNGGGKKSETSLSRKVSFSIPDTVVEDVVPPPLDPQKLPPPAAKSNEPESAAKPARQAKSAKPAATAEAAKTSPSTVPPPVAASGEVALNITASKNRGAASSLLQKVATPFYAVKRKLFPPSKGKGSFGEQASDNVRQNV